MFSSKRGGSGGSGSHIDDFVVEEQRITCTQKTRHEASLGQKATATVRRVRHLNDKENTGPLASRLGGPGPAARSDRLQRSH
jgi:hypothetical protein